MMKFVAEVPRFFTEITAEDLNAAKAELMVQAQNVVKQGAVIEDVTNKTMPSPKEALTARDDSLLSKIVNIFATGKSITDATGGTAFLGIGGGDVMFGADLCKSLGITDEVKPSMFLSFGGYLDNRAKELSTKTKTTEKTTA